MFLINELKKNIFFMFYKNNSYNFIGNLLKLNQIVVYFSENFKKMFWAILDHIQSDLSVQ